LAGLGRKEFNSGDILLASEVQGYLQDQAVMVFDDATARGSAIPSPSEGMLTYNKDTDQLELYDGSAFGPVGSDSGLIHIEQRTLSTTSSESFNNVFSADYQHYLIIMHYIASTAVGLRARLRASGSDITTSLSYQTQSFQGEFSTVTATNVNNDFFNLSAGANTTSGLNLLITNPFETTQTGIVYTGGQTSVTRSGTGRQNATTSSDGFTIFPSTGTLLSGTIDIFGYRTT
jgi:hypothetical protein